MKAQFEEQHRQIGLKIAYYRRYRNLTQEQLAERTGLSLVFLGHVEAPNVSKAISLDTLFLIAQALEIPAYKFLIFEDE
ncbi:helix-turn-helix transcriptional regulator [Clostridiaceae bacterium NSJ-31]|uniref:Helix-turn-helix transcriptional regulator n=1 Tax=Ligaoa zhengdingensis TaxID=2763658 RepID=A0A926I189_9FIRM|nr:helix-turn-helix transcriptional regulator [Ligaoa zhengdingensis]MBC8547817.1 helix-turn-helix transcriptional regulator [Ligaoa zhengdingensis]